jgi:hypothetical protein
VGNPGAPFDMVAADLGFQFGHPGGAARAAQFATLVYCHTAGIVTAVLQALESVDEHRDDVAGADCTDDSTHERSLISGSGGVIVLI